MKLDYTSSGEIRGWSAQKGVMTRHRGREILPRHTEKMPFCKTTFPKFCQSPEMEGNVRAAADLTGRNHSSISTHLLIAFSPHQLVFLRFGGVLLSLLGAYTEPSPLISVA